MMRSNSLLTERDLSCIQQALRSGRGQALLSSRQWRVSSASDLRAPTPAQRARRLRVRRLSAACLAPRRAPESGSATSPAWRLPCTLRTAAAVSAENSASGSASALPLRAGAATTGVGYAAAGSAISAISGRPSAATGSCSREGSADCLSPIRGPVGKSLDISDRSARFDRRVLLRIASRPSQRRLCRRGVPPIDDQARPDAAAPPPAVPPVRTGARRARGGSTGQEPRFETTS
jgi:hypothetical protein